MSEQNEYASDETEVENTKDNSKEEESPSEARMSGDQTKSAMLEDEEMPTYISISTPSKRDDSDVGNTKQQDRVPMEEDHSQSPYPSDDQGGGSVYLLSSGEESDRTPYNEEEEDEYGDSEDMDDMELENKHENAILDDEEEEDDEDDQNPLRMHNDEDAEFDLECFERASDDFVLNNQLRTHHKERSLSLQDLSVCKNNMYSPYNGKRHSLNVLKQNYLNYQQNSIMCAATQRRSVGPLKYRHIESKVKRYIKDIKEQTRRSIEKRTKERGYTMDRNHTDLESNYTEQSKPIFNKAIKSYAEKTIKELEIEEAEEKGKAHYDTVQILENGRDNKTDIKLSEDQPKNLHRDAPMNTQKESGQSEKNILKSDKVGKHNGSVEINTENKVLFPAAHGNLKLGDTNESLVNGHQQTPTVFNLCTLTYEEYMQGGPNSSQKTELNKNAQRESNEADLYNDADVISVSEVDNGNTCALKIENVKSIRMTSDELKDDATNLNFIKGDQEMSRSNSDNVETSFLKTQFNIRTNQFLNLRDAYQKVFAENLKMKQELDDLKSSLAKYTKGNEPVQMKTTAVQTETIVQPVFNQGINANIKQKVNKISGSSIGSTISSIDHWVDTPNTCSPAVSIKPPDLTNMFNSDDSMLIMEGTPKKTAHSLSRAFLTSSRILQTLSNITQGKNKPESPLVRNAKKRTNENQTGEQLQEDSDSLTCPSSSKKRKATDMLGNSTFLQPFKIPHIITDTRKKLNSTSDLESKYSEDNLNIKSGQALSNSMNSDANSSDNHIAADIKTEETDEQEENVKCFVYRENDNSTDRSFLIQAEEPTKEKEPNEKGRVKECGPYLLGNVEVRMSEVNGTINIWGKEINQDSAVEDDDEMDISSKSVGIKRHCWQKTPQTRFNGSQIVCSTSKKSKTPVKFRESNSPYCPHSVSFNTKSFTTDEIMDKQHAESPCSANTVIPCGNCDSPQYRKEWPTCKRISNSQEKLHSCCTHHHIEFSEKECSCILNKEKQKYNCSPSCTKEKLSMKEGRKSLCRNTPDYKHLHESYSTNAMVEIGDGACRYHTARMYRHSSHNPGENCQQSPTCCNTSRDILCACKSSNNLNTRENDSRHFCNSTPSNEGEEDPLISRRSNESLETRQRRLRGKKVRGILMDLLKGCGDCRNTSSTTNKGYTHEKEVPYIRELSAASCLPQIKVSPCPTPEPSCSNSVQPVGRCCQAYARRIETQLEEFRIEMERIRSRSDAILNMLNMLHTVDMN